MKVTHLKFYNIENRSRTAKKKKPSFFLKITFISVDLVYFSKT